MYHKYTGIILKKHPLGEADEMFTIFTKEAGKIRVRAVSSRKIQSRLAGHLQSLNEVEFETAGRAALEGMPVLVSVRTLSLNNYLRENLKKFACALVGAETLYRLAPDKQENGEAYQALVGYLKDLRESMAENLCLRRFQLRLLEVMGFGAPESETALDRFLRNVLEREIKSSKFLQTLDSEN